MKWLKEKISVSYKSFVIASVIFLSLPVIMFFLGMLKLYIGIPLALVWIWLSTLIIKDYGSNNLKFQCMRMTPALLFLLFIVIAILFGIGEFVWCDDDHKVRYAILNDLVNLKWPVAFDFDLQQNPLVKAEFGAGSAALVYYYVYWMVPALIGKLFGLMAARVTLVLWSAFGLFLVFMGMGFIIKRLQKRALYLLLFFGGLDILVLMVKTQMGDNEALLEMWNTPFVVHGNFAQLMNVFNQTIPCWLIAMFVYKNSNKKSIGFLGALMFFYSPWATIGFLPIALSRFFYDSQNRKWKFSEIKWIKSVNNILPEVIALIVMGSFYLSSSNGMSSNTYLWDGKMSIDVIVEHFLLYALVEFAVWAVLLFGRFKKNEFYWVMILEMVLLPLAIIPGLFDLHWRGSLVPMWFMTLMLMELISNINIKAYRSLDLKSLCTLMLIIVVSFGGLLQLMNIVISTATGVEDGSRRITSFSNIVDPDEAGITRHNYFAEEYQNTFFFKYLSK